MSVPVHCECGAFYNLKSEYAGRLLECPACHRHIRAPERQGSPLFDRDVFQLREKHFAIATKYHVRDEDGNPLMYVERPALIAQRLMAVVILYVVIVSMAAVFASLAKINVMWFVVIAAYF
ncbi:MAG TPA: hypothetical protein VN521_02055, partial [Negativicutes bacterium]|nr:hypothetical protein [Negativicutes bacterium]